MQRAHLRGGRARPARARNWSGQGYYVLRGAAARGWDSTWQTPGATRADGIGCCLFAQELAALLRAGLPWPQLLDVMLERQRDPVFRRSLSTVREKVRSGRSLSEAFHEEGELYPPIFSASLVAGERSGSLEQVLRRFTQYLRLNQTLRRKAISASVYPATLVVMMGRADGDHAG